MMPMFRNDRDETSPQGADMATPSRTKKVLFSALAGIGVTAGAAGIASAATSQTTPTDPAAVEQPATGQDTEQGDKETPPNYTSSITAPVTPEAPENGTEDEAAEDAAEAAETAELQKLAKISAEEAAQAATAAVPGTVEETELDNEGGNVVYQVEILADDGSEVDVIIDAGDGKVLAQETEGADDANEAPEANEAPGTETQETPSTAPAN